MSKTHRSTVSLIPEEQRPELKSLWREAFFAFDSNVLLNVFRYSSGTSRELLSVFEKLKSQLWLPYQAAQEYEGNRANVIEGVYKPFETVKQSLKGVTRPLKDVLQKFADANRLLQPVDSSIENTINAIGEALESLKAEVPTDTLSRQICDLFSGRVGNPYPMSELIKIYEEAERRFRFRVPPGYEDAEHKPIPERYGDVVLWLQVIDRAVASKRSVIFVTDDRKQDWFAGARGKRTGPRPELLREVGEKAGVHCHIYEVDAFLKAARTYLNVPISENAISEVQTVAAESKVEESPWFELGRQFADLFAVQWFDSIQKKAGRMDRLTLEQFWASRPPTDISMIHGLVKNRTLHEIAIEQERTTSEVLAAFMDLYKAFVALPDKAGPPKAT